MLPTASSAAVVEALSVSKRYRDRNALCGVDLVARAGIVHGLLGPNGAGKTTLMRVLLGLVRRDAGTVRILGRDIDAIAGSIPSGVAGFVDSPRFYPYLSGRQNLLLLARLDEDRTTDPTGRVGRVLEEIGLSADADRAVHGYSAGMRQRLGIAASLLRAPKVLFLDEPTNSLDLAGARPVRALARKLADDGAAVVLSSHDMAEVEELCDVITVIDGGRVVFSGTVGALRILAPCAVHTLRTSDDRAALEIAAGRVDVTVKIGRDLDAGLEVSGDHDALDAFMIALGMNRVAVRVLERRARSLESLFLELTGQASAEDPAHHASSNVVVAEASRAVS